MANFFVELQRIYKKIPGVIPDTEALCKLEKSYQGWNRYFSFKKPQDLETYKNSVKEAEKYLIPLKKSLVEFVETLQLE